MSDRFHPMSARRLAAWIATELEGSGSIFGIPRELWFTPSPGDGFTLSLRGHRLECPIGVAAGPHTQLAQNIVVAWLCGARVIELKTVQTLDRITVAKPCIDMQDEGYNIEWSQELEVAQSFREYLKAWFLIHALHARLGLPGESPGLLFDLSVGYDLTGLQQPNMHWFLDRAGDGGDEFERCRDAIAPSFPEVLDLEIPTRLADSVTVSTLHGCPPNEIGAIAEHLLGTWGLHTAVKLNPTLIGFDSVRTILIDELGWDHIEPHKPAFDDDIDYESAAALLGHLIGFGRERGLEFGVKLCNTLPVVNRRPAFDDGEPTAYLSGRPLHALAVALARRLKDDFGGRLSISFAGGADAFNTPSLLAAGLRPVTICSDLLRPGGYLRLRQVLEEIDTALDRTGAGDLDEFVVRSAADAASADEAATANLRRYSDDLSRDPELARSTYRRSHTKTARTLGPFDCVEAPCVDACSVGQRVPDYMRHVAAGRIDRAADVIADDNPLPSILGRACHHPCEQVCSRTHLDHPLAIREIKRFVTDHARASLTAPPPHPNETRVAVIGAGPCGLAVAWELARAGVPTEIFESRDEGGGMVSATIPGYRASPAAVRRDLEAVSALGVTTHFGISVGHDPTLTEIFERGFSDVVVAVGAQRGVRLGIEGENAAGVLDGLDFLRASRGRIPEDLGARIAVIGGGDVAIDCARSARRLTTGEVEILYRRTVDQMPAHPEEICDLLAEGISIRELVAPRRVVTDRGRIRSLECTVMTLGESDDSGRPRPIEVPGDGITIELDTLIVAIGQRADLGVFGAAEVATSPNGYLVIDPDTLETSIPHIFAGGDLRDPGPSNIVDACGDGRRIAAAILMRRGGFSPPPKLVSTRSFDPADILRRRSHREPRVVVPRRITGGHDAFDEVVQTLDPAAAEREAGRCLDCDLICSTCDGVCPNRAILTYRQPPLKVDLPRVMGRTSSSPRIDGACKTFEVAQETQVAVVADFCNECGNCATFCPTVGRPWRDKPRLFFHRPAFESEIDNAFMLLRIGEETAIQARFSARTHQLVVRGDLDYRGAGVSARLKSETLDVLELDRQEPLSADGGHILVPCATMWALLRGLMGSMPHLPVTDAEPGWIVESR